MLNAKCLMLFIIYFVFIHKLLVVYFFSLYFCFMMSIVLFLITIYNRFSGDLSAVLNPYLQVETLDQLLLHVIETRALMERLFPSSEQAFIFHEMIEVVNHLKLFGPAKSLMCFAGERTMKKIGDGVTDGGQKYIISVTKRYVAKENAFDSNMASYREGVDRYTDNSGCYSGVVLKLFRNLTKVSLEFDSKDKLFNSAQEFLATQEISSLVVKSPFIRLYFTFEGLLKAVTSGTWHVPDGFPTSFAIWIDELDLLRKREDVSSLTARYLVRNVVLDVDPTIDWQAQSVENHELLADQVMSQVVDPGCVFLSDFDNIIEQLASLAVSKRQPLATFTHAVVKGVEMSARGSKFVEPAGLVREYLAGTIGVGLSQRYLIQNPDNKLRDSWYPQQQINSWCKITDHFVRYSRDTKQVIKKHYLGQLNYFFRLSIPCDKILDGVAFANAVLRTEDYSSIRGCYQIPICENKQDDTYYPHKQFVPLNYIDSTAFSVTAFDAQGLPMMSPTATLKVAKDVIKNYPLVFSKLNSNNVARLDLVELHKERLHVEYLTVEEDRDHTKVFEKCVLEHHNRL